MKWRLRRLAYRILGLPDEIEEQLGGLQWGVEQLSRHVAELEAWAALIGPPYLNQTPRGARLTSLAQNIDPALRLDNGEPLAPRPPSPRQDGLLDDRRPNEQ